MNEKISALTNYTTPIAADVLPIVNTAGSVTDKVTMANLMNVRSDLFMVKDATDNTKQVAFNVSGLTTATVRTLTVPDASDTLTLNTQTQTLTNKTLGTGTKINTSGSDATGNIYYRDGSGNLAPMATPSDGSIVSFLGGVPVGIPNPSAANASTTVKGIGQLATTAQITAGTATGSTGAALLVPASAVGPVAASSIVQFNASTQYPAADGSLITNVIAGAYTKISTVTMSAVALPNGGYTVVATWTGLTGDTDDEYFLDFEATQSNGGTANGQTVIVFNNNVSANYITEAVRNVTATATTSTNGFYVMGAPASAEQWDGYFMQAHIKSSKTVASTSRMIIAESVISYQAAAPSNNRITGVWADVTNQITSIQVYMNVSGGTATVSGKATLYKINR